MEQVIQMLKDVAQHVKGHEAEEKAKIAEYKRKTDLYAQAIPISNEVAKLGVNKILSSEYIQALSIFLQISKNWNYSDFSKKHCKLR